jgi:wyosine [tRNA(Phe)-imidazoG37] synthetase (radical SAM superfamily)
MSSEENKKTMEFRKYLHGSDIDSLIRLLESVQAENAELREKLNTLNAHDKSFMRVSVENSKLKKRIEALREALKFYGEKMNYSVDHETSDCISRRVILYSDQEEINEFTIVAGRRAREALRKDDEAAE